jgi:hypothetical protein
MIPIVFGALIRTLMDIGLFAYWWTGVAGEFFVDLIPDAP